MKKLILILLFTPFFINSQTNMNFEIWGSSLTSNLEPAGWGSLNADAFIFSISHPLITSTFQEISSPGQGISSVKLITTSGYNSSYFANVLGLDTLGGLVSLGMSPYLGVPLGIPYTQKPTSVDLMYKSNIASGDTGVFLVQLSHWNGSQRVIDGDAMMLFTGNISNWSSISLPISYNTSINPDTLVILASSSSAPWLDNIGGPSPNPIPGSELEIDAINLNIFCPPPTAYFSQMALGQSAAFFDSSSTNGFTTYNWDFGDSLGFSFLPNPVYYYMSPGTYNVCLIVTDSCGSDTLCQTIIISSGCPPPTAYFSHMALGQSAAFFDSSSTNGFTTYNWNFGDSLGFSFLPNPVYYYMSPGTYNVCLIVTDSCGSDTACQNLIISSGCPPPASFFMASSIGLSASFTDVSSTTGTSTYSWDFGDGSGTSTMQNPVYSYSVSGIYNVCLVVTDSCGSDSTCLPVTVIDTSLGCPPPISFFMSFPTGLSVNFTDLSATTGSTTYSWDFGDGSGTSTLQNPSYTYSIAGLYNVCLFVSDSCDTASTCIPIVVIDTNLGCPPPIPMFMAVANGLTSTFTDLSAINGSTTYSWNFGDGLGTSTLQNPIYTYSTSGLYNVCLFVSDSCDTATICLPIMVLDSTIINIQTTKVYNNICKVFPNPATDKINFLINKVINPGEILIYDNMGRLIKTISYQDTFIEVNTSLLSNGIYYYNFTSNNAIISGGKFIIQKE